MPSRVAIAVVFLISTFALGWNLPGRGVAATVLDPVGGVRAQDEAVYAHSAIRIAEGADWLTPRFMGRPATYKPPLLYWLNAASMKALGVGPIALRLPTLAAMALATTLLFVWAAEFAGIQAGWIAAVLLLSNRLWQTLARVAIMDGLLVSLTVAALYTVWRGRRSGALHNEATSTRALAIAGALCGAAILTKGLAGLLPLLILMAVLRLRTAVVFLAAAAVASPWFIHQLMTNFDWFWSEFVLTEILHWGVAAPLQTSPESGAWFYLKRLILLDPVLGTLGLASLVMLARRTFAGREKGDSLLITWAAISITTILAFGYHNATYLLPLVAVLAVSTASMLTHRRALIYLGIALAAKLAMPAMPWALPTERSVELPAAKALRGYCRMQRPHTLLIVEPNDEFYASVLPLHGLRYAFHDSGQAADRPPLDFRDLRILVSVGAFLVVPEKPLPYGSGILYTDPAELKRLEQARPEWDILRGGTLTLGREPSSGARSGSPDPSLPRGSGSCESLP